MDIVPPYPTAVEINNAFNVNITFTENVVFSEQPDASDLELVFFGAESFYQYEIQVREVGTRPTKFISIDFIFKMNLKGGGKDIMQIMFNDPSTLFQDLQGNPGLNNAVNVTLPYHFYLTAGEQ